MSDSNIRAKIISDRTGPTGSRLISVEATFHRFILPEVNTYRQFCLDGETELLFDLPAAVSDGRSQVYRKKIRDLYKEFHEGYNVQPVADWRIKKMFLRSLNEETKEIKHTHISDIFYSGRKECYKITTTSGKTITCSENHLFYTDRGWQTLVNMGLSRSESNVISWNEDAPRLGVNGSVKSSKKKPSREKLVCKFESIKSIEYVGLRDTYDISVEDEVNENFVANGFIVHNSKNAASSRAISSQKRIAEVKENPAIPVFWGKNEKGMIAHKELNGIEKNTAQIIWDRSAELMSIQAQKLVDLGVHKQIASRLLEPFLYQTMILTSTDFTNMFNQRIHADAQPEFRELAIKIKEAIDGSESTPIGYGEWTLPYISEDEEYMDVELLKKISVARVARTSYGNNGPGEIDKDLALFERLRSADPMHSAPMEPIATPAKPDSNPPGNFKDFFQFRHIIESERDK